MQEKRFNINTVLYLVIIVVLLIIAIELALIPKMLIDNMPDELPATEGVEDMTEADPLEESTDNLTAMTDIETLYGILKYPAEYCDYLKISENNENGVFSQTYYCVYDSTEEELFTVYFGEVHTEYALGYLEVDGVQIDFGISVHDITRTEEWTDEKYTLVCDMQESVNDVMQSVMTMDNFVKNS